MKMRLYVIIIFHSVLSSIETQVPHKDVGLMGCSDADDKEVTTELDGDEVVYADFNRRKAVSTLPEFADQIYWPGFYDSSLRNIFNCKINLYWAAKFEDNPPEWQDPPQSMIFPKDDVELGKNNTLICFINHFFPPPVKVKWTRNDIEVKEGVTLSRYYPNSDGTFNQFSTLSFTPEEGDVYACTVEHKALTEPLTRMWEPEVTPQAGVGATVYCGLGLTVGLLGVAIGTFFLIKGNNCN